MLLTLMFSLACKDRQPADGAPDSRVEVVDDSSEDTGQPCADPGADPMRIDACWQVVATPEVADQAALFASGRLLIGCEDELPPLTVVSEAGDAPAIVLSLDPTIAPEAYTIRAESRRIRITGADRPGLAWGLIDWLRSLDRVDRVGGTHWRPDPTSTLSDGPTVCSDYDAACAADESCNPGGAWTAVEAVWWHPQAVDNHPDLPLRLAFASFKGSQNATFLPTIWHSELASCADSDDTTPFWDTLTRCDAQAPPDEEGYDPCDEVRLRLDTLLLGRFSHALDDGYNFRMGESVQQATGCSPTRLYADAAAYLEARGVQLIPTVYGQETRAPETPMSGRYIFEEEPAELWGKDGDATLSEGLAMGGTFTVCDVGGRRLLALDCAALDADGRVSEPQRVSPTYDTDQLAVGARISQCDAFELCAVREDCWDTVSDHYGLALTPADPSRCNNPALRMPLEADGRWYVLRFRASVVESADILAKLVIQETDGRSYAGEFGVLSTLASEGDYLYPTSPVDGARGDWAMFSYVFRAPEPDAQIDAVYLQLNGVPGSLAMLDDLDLSAIDGQLREVDPASLVGPDCAVVENGATAPLAVQPWFDADGAVSGALATITADCLAPGDTVELRYRSWSHFGLWPGHASRQSGYTYTVDVREPRYWEDPASPLAQIDAYRADGELGDYLLVSDLGGEARGIGRAEALTGMAPDDVLAGFACMIESQICDGCGSCDDMLRPPDDPDFAACTCADWTGDTRLLLAGDMFTPLHNGGDPEAGYSAKEGYQLPYGGPRGGTWSARRAISAEAVYLSWFHFDSRKDGEAVGGHEMVMGLVEDFSSDSLSAIPVSAWDPDAQRAWAALALAAQTDPTLHIPGVGHYGWGTDSQAARVMLQAGAVFWSPGWRQLHAWLQSDDPALPGGDESPSLTLDGLQFADSEALDWPITGRWLQIVGDTARWTGPAVPISGDRVLARVYATPPAGCAWTGRFDFGGSAVDVPLTPAVVDEYRVWGFSADRPPEATTVAFSLLAAGCAGGVIDDVTLYERMPVNNFPYPPQLEHLDAWDSAEEVDARNRICGDPLDWTCVNQNTWGE